MSHEQLRHNCEYHRGVACMVNADEVLKILDELDRLSTEYVAELEAALALTAIACELAVARLDREEAGRRGN